ncbi:MAG: hypothetical protein R3F49_02675 [Planctomycetota bacterium]
MRPIHVLASVAIAATASVATANLALAGLSPGEPSTPSATEVSRPWDDPVLAYFSGDGLAVSVTRINEETGEYAGSLTLGGGAPMPFTLEITLDSRDRQVGKGEVVTAEGAVALTTKERLGDKVLVRFGGRSYTVLPGAAPQGTGGAGKPSREEASRSAPATTAAALANGGPIVLSQHTFKDAGMGGMASHKVLVPKGWKPEGGAFWAAQSYFNVLPSQDIKVTSPEGVSVHIEPSLVAKDFIPGGPYAVPRPRQGVSDGGYPVLYLPNDLNGWKRWFERELIPQNIKGSTNVKVVNLVVIPELTYALGQACAPLVQLAEMQNRSSFGMGARNTVDWYVLGLESTYRVGGKEFEELRVLAVTCLFMDSELLGRQTVWTIERALTFTAPKGQLEANMPVLKAVADSVQMTPEWFMMRAEHEATLFKIQREVAADNMRAAQKRSEIIAQSGRDLNEIITGGYKAREAISDRTHEKVIQSIRGTEEYVVPGGTEYVQLPDGYRNVFGNGLGDYLLTNDEFFQPGTEPALNGQEWTRMGVRR